MKDIQQLIKKNSQEGRYEDIFPKTFTDAIKDKETNESLGIILNRNNFLFLTYIGGKGLTRLQVPMSYRRSGLWVAYQMFDKTLVVEFFKGDYIDNEHWVQDVYWFPYNTAEYQPKSVDLRALAQDVFDYISNEITTAGNILYNTITDATDTKLANTTTLLPEDLSRISNKIQLADRTYDYANYSGLGYVILRKNLVEGKNILTQSMINQPNTIYEIRYDFDLNNSTVTIPSNCTLKFEGGLLSNGTLNVGGCKFQNGIIIENYITCPIVGTYSKGQCLYDTTLNKPKWWDGTAWKDAVGTVV